MQSERQSLKVIVRVRPLSKKQQQAVEGYQVFWEGRKKQNNKAKLSQAALSFFSKYHNVQPTDAIKIQANCISVCDQQYKNVENKFRNYVFSGVYGTQVSNQSIFWHSLKDEISGVFQGINCTVLAYGITGSGKTFSVFGHPKIEKDRGLCNLSFQYLLNKKKELELEGTKAEMKFSFIEIYNENVRDLLSEDGKKQVNIGEDAKGNLSLIDVNEVNVRTVQQITHLISSGIAKRTSASTDSNQISSRSHAVLKMSFQVVKEGRKISSKLFIIDLAGSEKINTDNCLRKQQGTNINRSLLSLGNCINALIENSKKPGVNHIPYRDSKLTRLLKDSLGGTARTIMLACISPHPFTLDQTITTLNYAERAQGIKKEIMKNEVEVGWDCPRCREMANLPKTNESAQKQPLIQDHSKYTLKANDNQTGGIYMDIFQRLYNDIVENAKQSEQIQKLKTMVRDPLEELQILERDNQQQRVHLKQMLMDLLREKVKENTQPTEEAKVSSARKKIRLSNSSRKHTRNMNTEKQNEKENTVTETVQAEVKNKETAVKQEENANIKSFDSHVKLFQTEKYDSKQAKCDKSSTQAQTLVVHKRRRSKFQVVPRPPLSGRKLSEDKSLTERNSNEID